MTWNVMWCLLESGKVHRVRRQGIDREGEYARIGSEGDGPGGENLKLRLGDSVLVLCAEMTRWGENQTGGVLTRSLGVRSARQLQVDILGRPMLELHILCKVRVLHGAIIPAKGSLLALALRTMTG
jgi:hypothetical protein